MPCTAFRDKIYVKIKKCICSLVTGPILVSRLTKCSAGSILETSCSLCDKAVILSVCLICDVAGPYTPIGSVMEVQVAVFCLITAVLSQQPEGLVKYCECCF